jgi:hypothetical protein
MIMNGLLNELSSTMVLPPGQKTSPGTIAPLYICSTTSSGYRLLLKLELIKLQEHSICWQTKQSTKMHNAIYQNHLALDYLLASGGRVCGKFKLSNYCLQIDDEGRVIEEITDQMKKIAHVPVQT